MCIGGSFCEYQQKNQFQGMTRMHRIYKRTGLSFLLICTALSSTLCYNSPSPLHPTLPHCTEHNPQPYGAAFTPTALFALRTTWSIYRPLTQTKQKAKGSLAHDPKNVAEPQKRLQKNQATQNTNVNAPDILYRHVRSDSADLRTLAK